MIFLHNYFDSERGVTANSSKTTDNIQNSSEKCGSQCMKPSCDKICSEKGAYLRRGSLVGVFVVGGKAPERSIGALLEVEVGETEESGGRLKGIYSGITKFTSSHKSRGMKKSAHLNLHQFSHIAQFCLRLPTALPMYICIV